MTLIRTAAVALSLLAFAPAWAGTKPEPAFVVDGRPVYGAAMPEGNATTIGTALNKSADFAGTPQKFSGRVTKVCQSRGCWMVLAEGETHARVMFGKDDFFIPTDTSGDAVVYGTLSVQTMSEKMARHMAKDAGQDASKIEGDTQEFQITATSVMLLPAS
jgi:hypothetical protein